MHSISSFSLMPLFSYHIVPTAFMASKAAAPYIASGGGGSIPRRVVVCGGGVIGVCTAYFLASKSAGHLSVIVVEKSSIASAASGKAGGFLALDWCDGTPVSELARASFLLHRQLADLLDGPRTYGYRPLTTLSLSVSASATCGSRTSGLPPWVDCPTASMLRKIGTPETTAQVHPQLFTRVLLSFATAEHGVQVVYGDVQRIELNGTGDCAAGVSFRDGRTLSADAVVLALGPWSGRLPLVSSLFNVSGLKAHSLVLRPQEPNAISPHALFLRYQPTPASDTLDPEVYPRPTGEVYICGLSKKAIPPDDPEEIVGEPGSIAMLHEIAATVSSHLKVGAAELVAEQACFLPCTDDGLPVIGEIPGAKGCYVATGHSCWGILNGPATGASLAELIMEGSATTVNLKPFSPARFLRGK